MRIGKFLILSVLIIAIFALAPDQLAYKDILSFNVVDMPFSNKSPEEIESETYDSIYQAFINLSDQTYLSKKLTSDQVFDIRERVISDNPQLFYLDYENSKYWSNGKLEFVYIDSKENIENKLRAMEERVDYIISKIIQDNMSDLEKELAVHDYIVRNTEYDIENYEKNTIPNASYNLEGVLLKGKAVCEGYAKTFKLMMDKLGIESMIVSSAEINHAWNMVKIDGDYYHVDLTWNDPVPDRKGKVRYMYFNVSDRKMLQGDHRWDQEKYPKAISEKYSYMWDK